MRTNRRIPYTKGSKLSIDLIYPWLRQQPGFPIGKIALAGLIDCSPLAPASRNGPAVPCSSGNVQLDDTGKRRLPALLTADRRCRARVRPLPMRLGDSREVKYSYCTGLTMPSFCGNCLVLSLVVGPRGPAGPGGRARAGGGRPGGAA